MDYEEFNWLHLSRPSETPNADVIRRVPANRERLNSRVCDRKKEAPAMTLYIGVDIHARQQTVSYLDTEDGSIEHQELHHERDDIRAFHSQFSGEVIVGTRHVGTRTGLKRW